MTYTMMSVGRQLATGLILRGINQANMQKQLRSQCGVVHNAKKHKIRNAMGRDLMCGIVLRGTGRAKSRARRS